MTMRERRIGFLRWVKDLDQRLQKVNDPSSYYNLSDSSISSGTDLLLSQLQHIEDWQHRLQQANAWGPPRLITQIAETYGVDSQRVLTTTGASNAIFLVCQSLIEPGDHVVIETPVYEPLLAAPVFLDAKVSLLKRRAEDNYDLNLDELSRLLRRETRLVLLSNLHNPSGAVLSKENLREIASRVSRSRAKVLVDEVYHDFVEHDNDPAAVMDDVFVSINSLSKVYGLSAVRCGWIIADIDTIEQIRQTYVIVENIGSRVTETMASIAMDNLKFLRRRALALSSQNREVVNAFAESLQRDGLLAGNVQPFGCVYFPRLEFVENGGDMHRFLHVLEKDYRVFVAPGSFFQAHDHIRIGFGGESRKVQVGLSLLEEAIRSLV